MTKLITISQLQEELERLKEAWGDIPVAGVSYHSDFRDDFLYEHLLSEQLVLGTRKYTTPPELRKYLLIYGGGR